MTQGLQGLLDNLVLMVRQDHLVRLAQLDHWVKLVRRVVQETVVQPASQGLQDQLDNRDN